MSACLAEPGCCCTACDLARRLDATPAGRTLAIVPPAAPVRDTLPAPTDTSLEAVLASMPHGLSLERRPGHRCGGALDNGCDERVEERGDSCPTCRESYSRGLRREHLQPAADSLPVGWEHADLAKLTKIDRRIAAAARAWNRERGNLLLCGPTGVGKTTAAIAIGRRVVSQAEARALPAADMAFASGLRFMSWLEIVESDRGHRYGQGEDCVAMRAAKAATLLILDEVGFEDDARPVLLLRGLTDARGRDSRKRTIATTGKSREDLVRRYDAAIVRKLEGPESPGVQHCVEAFG